jgi:hypothetical protein
MTQGLVFGIVLIVRLVPESVKPETAPMDGLSQHVQLEEHGTACDQGFKYRFGVQNRSPPVSLKIAKIGKTG